VSCVWGEVEDDCCCTGKKEEKGLEMFFGMEGVLVWGREIDSESWGWDWGRRREQVVEGKKGDSGGFTPEVGQGTLGGQGSKIWEV